MPLKGLILADNFINPCRKLPLRVTQCNFIHKFNSKFSFPHPLYALCKSAQLSRSDPFPTMYSMYKHFTQCWFRNSSFSGYFWWCMKDQHKLTGARRRRNAEKFATKKLLWNNVHYNLATLKAERRNILWDEKSLSVSKMLAPTKFITSLNK